MPPKHKQNYKFVAHERWQLHVASKVTGHYVEYSCAAHKNVADVSFLRICFLTSFIFITIKKSIERQDFVERCVSNVILTDMN